MEDTWRFVDLQHFTDLYGEIIGARESCEGGVGGHQPTVFVHLEETYTNKSHQSNIYALKILRAMLNSQLSFNSYEFDHYDTYTVLWNKEAYKLVLLKRCKIKKN